MTLSLTAAQKELCANHAQHIWMSCHPYIWIITKEKITLFRTANYHLRAQSVLWVFMVQNRTITLPKATLRNGIFLVYVTACICNGLHWDFVILYPTHIIFCKVPQSSSEYQTQIKPQRPGRFSNTSQRRAPIGRLVQIKKQTLNIPLSMVKLLHFGWCVNTPSFRRGRKPFSDFTMRLMGTLKQLNGCDRRKLRMDHNTNLNDKMKRRKSVQNLKNPKHASCLQQDIKVILQNKWQSN